MGGDPSAYAALGLEPGSDPAAVERAYKRLIKEHHPDREGGDGTRAAEINRAYRDLRGPREKDALEFNDHPTMPRRRGWAIAALSLAVGLAAGLALARPVGELWMARPDLPLVDGAAAAGSIETMDQPLNLSLIDESARKALQMSRSQDEMALAAASQECHRALRSRPSLPQLDRCAAFDDAVVQLQDRDPLRDRGPFAQLAVTGRQWSSASALSGDYLTIDSRLDRIRLRVELELAEAIQSPEQP